jgi:GT2 family glycosyltransferase/glycosyltransferase involved in cell wall biosynthesis/uncharacterized coiled-coil DUF342 family protein
MYVPKQEMPAFKPTFVHSLFRAGSTFLYNALKQTDKLHVYHEPMHEIIATLPTSWKELSARKNELKATLRHDFLVGGYFDEFYHLLPSIKNRFQPIFSFNYYFMDSSTEAPDLKAYIELLIDGAPKSPVLQCTRTSGRINWLKHNFFSNHIFLLRNPWDQWYSYKVDQYIATTPRMIYSQENLPEVLGAVFEASGARQLAESSTQSNFLDSFNYPISPDQDYFLFFGLWLYSFICGERDCDVFIDMDKLSSSSKYMHKCLDRLKSIGIDSINLADARLHRTIFDEREQLRFRRIEEQVFEIYRQHGIHTLSAHTYLNKSRQKSFTSIKQLRTQASDTLEDAYRMRQLLISRDEQIVIIKNTVAERNEQIDRLSNTISELRKTIDEQGSRAISLEQQIALRDSQIVSINQAIFERDEQIDELNKTINDLQKTIDEQGSRAVSLEQQIALRDSQIVSINQAIFERDEQIDELSKTINDLQKTIDEQGSRAVSLEQQITLRDSQIVSINQTIFERDEQIDVLSKTINDLQKTIDEQGSRTISLEQQVVLRDSQIASINQAVRERDEQIAELSKAISDLQKTVGQQSARAFSLEEIIVLRDNQIADFTQAVAERDDQIANLLDETIRRGEWALGIDTALKEERARLLAVTTSNSWRITRPLREARRFLLSPNKQIKRYAIISLILLKRIYQSLPLSLQTKYIHRQWLAKFAPRILLASGAHPSSISILNIPDFNKIYRKENNKYNVIPYSGFVADTILLASSNTPMVSVIIPIYGKIDYTMRCLFSIAANPPQVDFEVIIVDDCSPDNSWEVLKNKVIGIRMLRNKKNLGFIRSSNIGANAAKGKYILFLNNDTEVTPGWLEELLRTYYLFPGTGLVGSKLVYPDGRLQEAGGIIWQDGNAWNFGRYQDPQLPVFNYAREVDYCSGASIMVPKSLFDELGGFDEHYLPAYCEDSDLALKIREKGLRVIYQPQSTIIHYEGITSGTDTAQGAKSFQVENIKKQFKRWQNRLASYQASDNNVDNAKDRRATRRVLVLDHCTPTPDQDAGSVTVFNLMMLLREMDFQVTFIPEDNFLYIPEYTSSLQRNGIEVLYAPFFTSVEQHLKEQGQRYNLALIFRPTVMERHLPLIRRYCTNAKVLFHTVDLHYIRMFREAELHADKEKKRLAEEMKQREFAAIVAADACIIHSTTELDILKPLFPDVKLYVFPLILNIPGSEKAFSDRRDIVFLGGYQHSPNVDAVHHFVQDVLPLIRKQLPGVRFYVVGSNPPTEIQALASEDVIITGFVKDLNPLLSKMRVSVAPLRYGAGIKGKIGTAMAFGLPVVATSLATEGMLLKDGENILVANSPEAFANTVASIYHEEALWNSISQSGLNFAVKTWGAEAAWETFASILRDLAIQVKPAKYQLTLYSGKNDAF